MKINIPEKIIFEFIKEEGFLFNQETEKVFEVNGTGVFIINQILEGNNEKSKIIKAVLEEYEVEGEIAESSFNEFIKSLKEFNIINVEE